MCLNTETQSHKKQIITIKVAISKKRYLNAKTEKRTEFILLQINLCAFSPLP